MSEAFQRVLPYVDAFYEGLARCRTATTFNAADYQDAYNRLSRLRDRYLFEKRNLEPYEEKALRKVFEEDPFIEGVLDGRQIGEHVKIKNPVIRLNTNSPIPLCTETSAGSFFAGRVASVRNAQGKILYIDHMEQLGEAEKRVQRALARATNNLS